MWIRAEYVGGRLEEGTKVWTCCGSHDPMSFHCPSREAREDWWMKCEREEEERAKAEARREEARLRR